jgi:hypothetical protein
VDLLQESAQTASLRLISQARFSKPKLDFADAIGALSSNWMAAIDSERSRVILLAAVFIPGAQRFKAEPRIGIESKLGISI